MGRSYFTIGLLLAIPAFGSSMGFGDGSPFIKSTPSKLVLKLYVVADKDRGAVAILSRPYHQRVFATVDELKVGLSKLPEGCAVHWMLPSRTKMPPGGERFKDACDSLHAFCAQRKIEFKCWYPSS